MELGRGRLMRVLGHLASGFPPLELNLIVLGFQMTLKVVGLLEKREEKRV